MSKTKYRFVGTADNGRVLIWQSTTVMCGDSRVEEIRCGRAWFWDPNRGRR